MVLGMSPATSDVMSGVGRVIWISGTRAREILSQSLRKWYQLLCTNAKSMTAYMSTNHSDFLICSTVGLFDGLRSRHCKTYHVLNKVPVCHLNYELTFVIKCLRAVSTPSNGATDRSPFRIQPLTILGFSRVLRYHGRYRRHNQLTMTMIVQCGARCTFPVVIHIRRIPNAQQSTSSPISQPKSISGASHHSRELASKPCCLSSIHGGTFGLVAITMACSKPLRQTCPFTRKRTVEGRMLLCIMPALCMKEMPDVYQDRTQPETMVEKEREERSQSRTPIASYVRCPRGLRPV